MCVPPSSGPNDSSAAELAKLDSLRQRNCPRWMSSATEYYNNKNYKDAVKCYDEAIRLSPLNDLFVSSREEALGELR